MLKRKSEKKHPPRQQAILDECMMVINPKESTHLLFHVSFGGLSPGVYCYNPVSRIVTTIDDDPLATMPHGIISRKNEVDLLKHIPTWNEMIENGKIKDNRTKKAEENVDSVINESNKMSSSKIAPAVKRKLI